MKAPKAKKPGRKAETLKIQGDWRDGMEKAINKNPPKKQQKKTRG